MKKTLLHFNFSFLIGYIGIKYETRRRTAGSKICTMYLNFKEQNQKKIMLSTIFLPFTCVKWSDLYHFSSKVAFLFLLMALSLTKGQRQTGFKRKIADISGIKQVKNFKYLYFLWGCLTHFIGLLDTWIDFNAFCLSLGMPRCTNFEVLNFWQKIFGLYEGIC